MAWRRREKDVTKGKVRLTLHLNQVACVVGVKSGRGRGIRALEFPHPPTPLQSTSQATSGQSFFQFL